MFKHICCKTGPLLPENSVERSIYIFEYSEGITLECYPADELLDLDVMDNKVKEYIREGQHPGGFVLPELAEIVNYAKRNLNISPFDILTYKLWNETPESLYEFMTSSKGGAGSGKGRKKTKLKLFAEIIPKLGNYRELRKAYFHLVFEDRAGYGSGMPTYEWAFRLTSLIDQIINEPHLQDALRNELNSQKELVELGIHSFFLTEFTRESINQIMCMGKWILYNIQELLDNETA